MRRFYVSHFYPSPLVITDESILMKVKRNNTPHHTTQQEYFSTQLNKLTNAAVVQFMSI